MDGEVRDLHRLAHRVRREVHLVPGVAQRLHHLAHVDRRAALREERLGSDQQDARSSFERVLEIYPDDKPSQFYLRRIEGMSGEPWPYDWSGTIEVPES